MSETASPESLASIELRDVTKTLGGNDILKSFNLKLVGGQIVVLLGANGAGKTTLLHLLGSLYQPNEGEVLLNGEPLCRSRLDQRRRLHYLPDIPTISPAQTPLEYIAFVLKCYESFQDNDAALETKVIGLLKEFELLTSSDSPSRTLSRGQKYKATLIALLAVDPDIWILDEPFTSGMDPLGLTLLRRYMEQARERNRLIVYSTQLVEVARQLSDTVCILSDSQLAALGPIDSLEENAETTPGLRELLGQLRDVAHSPDSPESGNVVAGEGQASG